MNTLLKYILGLFLLVSINVKAQEAGKNSPIPGTKTAQERRELRKDKRIKRHEKRALKANNRKIKREANKSFHKARLKKAKTKQIEAPAK